MKRVIIAGGSGVIGQALTKQLLSQGYEVVILSRNPTQAGFSAPVQVVKWDGQTPAGWEQYVSGSKAIINLAGANIGDGRWSEARKKLIIESRVQATQAVVAAVQQAAVKPEVVLQASAVGYYGNRADELLSEASNPGQDFLAHICTQWEAAVAPLQGQTRVVILRTGVVLSTQNGALQKMLLPFKLFAGGPFGDGKQWFSWIHLEDEIAAILFLLNNAETSGVYNLTAPRPLTNQQFAKVLGQVLNRPSFIPAPAFALRLALGEMSALLLDGQRVEPKRLLEAGFTFRYPEPVEAVTHLITHNI